MPHVQSSSLVLHVVALISILCARPCDSDNSSCTVTARRLSCTKPDSIQEIPKLDLEHARNIKQLYICCQKNLTELTATSLNRYPNLEEIMIRDSELRDIDKAAFQNLNLLRRLDLRRNRIEFFNWKLINRESRNVTLLLHGNPLSCSCTNKWLQLRVSSESDEKTTCYTGPDGTRTPITRVNITDCSLPDVEMESFPLEVKVGDNITLNCTGNGFPETSVTWIPPKSAAVRPQPLIRHHGNMTSSTLTWQVRPQDHGIWGCSVENLAGKAGTTRHIIVSSSPEILRLSLDKKSSWCLHYQLRGWPQPNVTWYKDGRPLWIVGRLDHRVRRVKNNMLGCLAITSPTLKDNGNYTLIVTNDEGSTNRTILAKLINPPDVVRGIPKWRPQLHMTTRLVATAPDVTVRPESHSTPIWVLVALPITATLALLLVGASVWVYYVRRRQGQHKFKSIVAWQARSGSLFSDGDSGALNIDQLTREMMPLNGAALVDNPHYSIHHPAPSTAKSVRSSDMKLVRELGEGAFGRVYLGRWNGEEGDTLVAVKMAKNDLKSATRREFENEAELMTSLRHPNIVTFHGICSEEHSLFLVFEYMDQGDLNNFLRLHGPDAGVLSAPESEESRDTLTLPELMNIALQVACGMEYLACQHFVHRDLATRNCLVSGKLTVKIGDFGMSRDVYSTDYYRVGGQAMLPVRWMPPESLMYRKFTVESDVWSFGVVLWEIFTYGRQPWFEYANHEVMELVRKGQVLSRPRCCPNDVYQVMLGCWKRQPCDRLKMKQIHSSLKSLSKAAHEYLQLID